MRLSDRRILLLITRKRGPLRQIRGDVPEKALDHVHPRAERRGEMHLEVFMFFQQRFHIGMLVGGVVVGHQMQL